MLKYLFPIFLMISSVAAFAQSDSLFVVAHQDKWVIRHKITPSDKDVFKLARRYYAPPAMIAELNGIAVQQDLSPNSIALIPVGAYNLLNTKPATTDARPLYYRVANESVDKLARTLRISKYKLQEWNPSSEGSFRRGQVVMIGWVRYDQALSNIPPGERNIAGGSKIKVDDYDATNGRRRNEPEYIYIPVPDTAKMAADTMSEGQRLFADQTQNGAVVIEEKGTAAFFPRAGKSENGIYFAFHNVARRGTIIRIYNPGTDKTVYAKVIGKIPTRGIFHNAVLGLSADAKAELETGGEKVWCEISYAP